LANAEKRVHAARENALAVLAEIKGHLSKAEWKKLGGR
jgi:hypothetical protein